MLLRSLLSVLVVVGVAYGRTTGPPPNSPVVCNDISPSHGGSPGSGNGGYVIATNAPLNGGGMFYDYTAGQTYIVQVQSTNGMTFRGFLVQARDPSGMAIGTFMTGGDNQATVACTTQGRGTQTTIGHMHPSSPASEFDIASFTWTAPSGADGMVNFIYAVVRTMPVYWASLSAAAQTQVPIVTAATTAAPTAVPTEAPVIPINIITPDRAPENYTLIFRDPPSCMVSDCKVFVGIDINTGNDSYLDIYIEGNAGSWAAVGFSDTPTMFSADVLACSITSSRDNVEVLDTWNLDQGRGNTVDRIQDVFLFSGNLTDGRVFCSFARLISGSDVPNQDLDLSEDHFVMFGVSPMMGTPGRIGGHATNPGSPSVTAGRVNAANLTILPLPQLPANVTPPVRELEDYRITLRFPDNCTPSACDMFVGIDTNQGDNSYLDFYMEGAATGWLAVAFTETQNMFDADVLGCNINPNFGTVELLDTWNVGSPLRNNLVDTVQDVGLFNSSFVNGRIICVFARRTLGSDVAAQLDLNLNQPLFVMYGPSSNPPLPRELGGHSLVPRLSPVRINAAEDSIDLGIAFPLGPNNAVAPQNRGPLDHRLIFRIPPNCNPVSSCDLFVGIDTNQGDDRFLDFYMEGNATGWLAAGFSRTSNMFSADVLGCSINAGMVEVVDTWNPETRINVRDIVQDVVVFSTSLVNRRIMCSFARPIIGSDASFDLNLNGSYFILYGVSPRTSSGNLGRHDLGPTGNPRVTNAMVNPQTSTTAPPVAVPPQNRGPLDHRLIYRIPSGCDPVSSCDLFVGIDTNQGDNQVLDVYMEGNAAGWLAVGFSQTRDMFSADVLGCNINANMVEVLDTWNPAGVRNNVLDDFQDVVVFNTSLVNGRIMCSFGRPVMGRDETNDLNLGQPQFILYGVGPTSSPGSLAAHQFGPAGNPQISGAMVNPLMGMNNGNPTPSPDVRGMLTRAHGIIMILAWPVFAVIAIFFAAWMRPALPNGEWFQVHRAFMLGSLFLGAVGFILIFAAQYDRSPTRGLITLGSANPVGTAHFAIGIIVMLLHFTNPIISIFRCHPGKPRRWIFNLLHGTLIGLGAEILALINVAIGIALFSENFSRFAPNLTVFWVYLAWLVFFMVMIFILFLLYTIISITSDQEDRAKLAPSLIKPLISSGSGEKTKDKGIELAVPGQKPQEPPAEKPKVPSHDAPIRWVTLAVFAAITVPFMLVLIILVALGP